VPFVVWKAHTILPRVLRDSWTKLDSRFAEATNIIVYTPLSNKALPPAFYFLLFKVPDQNLFLYIQVKFKEWFVDGEVMFRQQARIEWKKKNFFTRALASMLSLVQIAVVVPISL